MKRQINHMLMRFLFVLFFVLFPIHVFAQDADYYVVKKNGVLVRYAHAYFSKKYLTPIATQKTQKRTTSDILRQPALEPFVTTASWYGPGFHGKRMANGERFDENNIIAAHRDWPLGSCARITSLENGNSISAPVLDRGPYIRGRDIDLSKKTMEAIGGKHALKKGLKRVLVEPVSQLECLWQ